MTKCKNIRAASAACRQNGRYATYVAASEPIARGVQSPNTTALQLEVEATDTAQPNVSNKPADTKSPAAANAPRPHSKIARLLGLLQSGSGASLEEMAQATGWQAHSVRAALTGLRKRGVAVVRGIEGTTTVWSIARGAQ